MEQVEEKLLLFDTDDERRWTKEAILHLADEIDELHRRLDAVGRVFDHQKRAEEFRREANEIRQDVSDYKKEMNDFIIKLSEATTRYISLVIGLGFVGYFSVWNFSRDFLETGHERFIALCGFLALSVFVLWEIYVLFMRLKSIGRLNAIFRSMIRVQDFEEERIKLLDEEARGEAIRNPIWGCVFIFTVSLMCCGGLVMLHQIYIGI